MAVAYGTGYCKLHTDEGNLPTGSVTMQAWVWASCDWDGWTLNEAEVDALNEGQGDGMLAEGRASYFWREVIDDWEFQYCNPDNPGESGYEEPGCPWW